MKRIDFYFVTSLISFILCLGFTNNIITSISGYFYFLINEPDIFMLLSAVFLFFAVAGLFKIIVDKRKYVSKKTNNNN